MILTFRFILVYIIQYFSGLYSQMNFIRNKAGTISWNTQGKDYLKRMDQNPKISFFRSCCQKG